MGDYFTFKPAGLTTFTLQWKFCFMFKAAVYFCETLRKWLFCHLLRTEDRFKDHVKCLYLPIHHDKFCVYYYLLSQIKPLYAQHIGWDHYMGFYIFTFLWISNRFCCSCEISQKFWPLWLFSSPFLSFLKFHCLGFLPHGFRDLWLFAASWHTGRIFMLPAGCWSSQLSHCDRNWFKLSHISHHRSAHPHMVRVDLLSSNWVFIL